MKHAILIGLMSIVLLNTTAQNEVDALRFSFLQTPGTARSLGMGGAYGALGADLSSFWINPGGIGVYRRGGVEGTLGISDMNSITNYEGEESSNGRANLTVQSLGMNSTRLLENSPIKSYTVGVAYGKSNNFYERINVRGTATNTTLLDVFAAQANGTQSAELMDVFPFGAGLAWESYVIDPLSEDDLTYVAAASGGDVLQSKTIERKGAMSETAFGGGINYMDWLYLGMSVSFHGISFTENSTYSERFFETDNLSSYSFKEDLRVTGTGAGVKFGAVARATPWLRLGAAWHSRVRYGLTDTYSASISSAFLDGGNEGYESPVNVSNYILRTPGRWVGSAAFILGEGGVVSADYEFSDFSGIRMTGTALNKYDYAVENETIETIYRSTHRVRAGAELRVAESWRARLGAQYFQSPFVKSANSNSAQTALTAGGGYRYDTFFIDLGITFIQRTEDYYLYDSRMIEPANSQITRLSFLLSGGVRF